MKNYIVKTRFVFEGDFIIKTSTKDEAREYVEKHCGLILGRNIHSTLPDDIIDWNFSVHPKKLTGRITLQESK
jgi:hypothetical protein